MSVTPTQIFQFILLLLIVFLTFSVIQSIREATKKRKFIIKSYLNEEEQANSPFFEKMTSLTKYKEHIEYELKEGRSKQTVKQFLLKRVMITLLTFILMLLLYNLSSEIIFIYLSIPLMFFVYKVPMNGLKRRQKKYVIQLKNELPDYLYHFAVLLESHTPYQATQKSVSYAGGLLKPHVNNLITQINLYPASHKPYYDFANSVQLREAKEFMSALEQIMKVDATASSQIIKDQISIMNELQEEAYNEQIEDRPSLVEPYINAMLFPFFVIIVCVLGVLISSSLSGI